MGYSRRTLNYLERLALYDLTHMRSIADIVAIGVETLWKDSGCSLEKEFIKLIFLNPKMILYLIANQVDLCHRCVCGRLT